MTKQDHINYWKLTSQKDWDAVGGLIKIRKYAHALFFAHLALEKLCKANWVKNNPENHPPRTHNLVKILSQTSAVFSEEDLGFLEEFNDFQLEGRYPDYMLKIYKVCNAKYTSTIMQKIKPIRQCLLKKLQ